MRGAPPAGATADAAPLHNPRSTHQTPVKALIWIAALLLTAAPLSAQDRPQEPAEERVHVVRSGDTLWDLARGYLSDPFLWPEIFRLNTDIVRNPARIYPSERLRIPGGAGFAWGTDPAQRNPTVFYPRDEQSRFVTHSVRAAGTADIPVLTPGDFYRAGFLAREREVRPIGRVVERLFPSVIALELPPQIQLYDRIYVTLDADAAASSGPGDRLHFYRVDRAVRQHGRLFVPTGIATVVAVQGNLATAVVIQIYDAMTVGDLAFPLADFPVPPGVLPVDDAGPAASVVTFQNPRALYMTEDVAFLDVGSAEGVREGDEFEVYLPAQRRRWGVRPEVTVARLQVVRVAGRTAAARVIAMEFPALEPGLPARRVARMP
jgi:hypothetical protein